MNAKERSQLFQIQTSLILAETEGLMERLQREVNAAARNAEEEDKRLQLIEREINHLQTVKNVIGKSQE